MRDKIYPVRFYVNLLKIFDKIVKEKFHLVI